MIYQEKSYLLLVKKEEVRFWKESDLFCVKLKKKRKRKERFSVYEKPNLLLETNKKRLLKEDPHSWDKFIIHFWGPEDRGRIQQAMTIIIKAF